MIPLRIFIGYDPREAVAYHTLSHSIIKRATNPVALIPLALPQLRHIYTRERGPLESTEFSLTRFLVPYLSGYHGWSIFMDCDMLVRCDITDIMVEMTMPDKAVLVCKHEYSPKSGTKMDGQIQTYYPRKNWSSFMVFNNEMCSNLTPEYVNTASGLDLHRFAWLRDNQIGSLPLEWNWLVDEYEPNPDAKILHYTRGGPWFEETENCSYAKEWLDERRSLDVDGKGAPHPTNWSL